MINASPQTVKVGISGIFWPTLSILLYKACLDYLYVNFIMVVFAYENYSLDPSLNKIFESYIIVGIIAVLLAKNFSDASQHPSRIVVFLYFIFIIVPLLSLYGLQNAPTPFVYIAVFCILFLIALLKIRVDFRIPMLGSMGLAFAFLSLIFAGFLAYGQLFRAIGVSNMVFDFNKIYDFRDIHDIDIPFPFGYFRVWQGKVFNVALLLYGLNKKSLLLVLIAIGLEVLMFGLTGHKLFIFAPFLAWGFYLMAKSNNFLTYFVGLIIILMLFCYSDFLFFGGIDAGSLIIRRALILPAHIHLIYYDFFSQPDNPFIFLSNSIFSKFVDYPYDVSMIRVISWAYWNRDFGPNVGYMGDAYGQFGIYGMGLFTLILGGFLKIFDSVGKRIPHQASVLLAIPAFSLTNGALFTSLLTHGLLMGLIVVWIWNEATQKRYTSISGHFDYPRNSESKKFCKTKEVKN